MALQHYTEEDLLAKKYNDLLKISKASGIKPSKRLKTEKLIEAILKFQQEESVQSSSKDGEAAATPLEGTTHTLKDGEAAAAPLEGTTHTLKDGELLLDIQFPGCGPQDSSDWSFNTANDTLSDAAAGNQETDVLSSSTHEHKKHTRSGTYELEEKEKEEEEEGKKRKRRGDNESKKRQRSSTFDLTISNDVTLPIDEKQTEANSKQVSMLADKVTVRGSRRRGGAAKPSPSTQVKQVDAKPTTKEGVRSSSKLRQSKKHPAGKNILPTSPWLAQESFTSSPKRQRHNITVSAPAPPLRPPRQSHGTPSGTVALSKTTTTTSTSKPKFTIGCGDHKDDKQNGQEKGTSGIPRFMSYARRLKVPNFALIHKKAFQRMEGLDDYVDKRKARQDTIGSTTKKEEDKTEVFQPSVTTVKNLNFNFNEASPPESQDTTEPSQPVTLNKQHKQNNTQAGDTLPKQVSSPEALKDTKTPRSARARRVTQEVIRSGKVTNSSKKSLRLSRKASPKSTRKIPSKPALKTGREGKKMSLKSGEKSSSRPSRRSSLKPMNDSLAMSGQKVKTGRRSKVTPKPTSSKKISTVTFPVFGSHVKENCKPGKQSVLSPMPSKLPVPRDVASHASVRQRMHDYSKGVASQKTSYVPYKGVVKPLKTRENLKTLAQRKHGVKTSKEIREGQKNILKGVRLNKRFELQMANRGITF